MLVLIVLREVAAGRLASSVACASEFKGSRWLGPRVRARARERATRERGPGLRVPWSKVGEFYSSNVQHLYITKQSSILIVSGTNIATSGDTT